MILTVRRIRAQVLGQWLLTIFDTKIVNAENKPVSLGQEILDHCAVTALSPKGQAPSYIDAKNFVSALFDKVTSFSKVVSPTTIDQIIESIATSTAISEELRRAFLIYANEAKDTFNSLTVKTTGAIEMLQTRIEDWYNSNMDRLTGTLKTKYTRKITFAAAVVVCLFLNADTIEISKYLYSNPDARAAVAAQAYKTGADDSIKADMQQLKQTMAAQTSNDTTRLTLNQLQDSLQAKVESINKAKAALDQSIPLGWTKMEFSSAKESGWLLFVLIKIIGLAVTVIAIMMGAPFWFDVLNKISNLRGSGKKPDTNKSS